VTDLSVFPGAKWFPGAKLNFAENLLRYRDDHLAFVFIGETQTSKRMTYAELYDAVARLAHSLKESGVGVGDRVVGIHAESHRDGRSAMLAAASLGATWASCATDIGPGAAIERLGQVATESDDHRRWIFLQG
jgi:acetoacetyl-CoA synthetase